MYVDSRRSKSFCEPIDRTMRALSRYRDSSVAPKRKGNIDVRGDGCISYTIFVLVRSKNPVGTFRNATDRVGTKTRSIFVRGEKKTNRKVGSDRKDRLSLSERLESKRLRKLTILRRSLIKDDRTVALEDLVLRTATREPSRVDTILGMVFDLTNRYSSPGLLLFFLNVPHSMFAHSFQRALDETRKRSHQRKKKRFKRGTRVPLHGKVLALQDGVFLVVKRLQKSAQTEYFFSRLRHRHGAVQRFLHLFTSLLPPSFLPHLLGLLLLTVSELLLFDSSVRRAFR